MRCKKSGQFLHRNTQSSRRFCPCLEPLELRLQPGEAFLTGLAVQLTLAEATFASPEVSSLTAEEVDQDHQSVPAMEIAAADTIPALAALPREWQGSSTPRDAAAEHDYSAPGAWAGFAAAVAPHPHRPLLASEPTNLDLAAAVVPAAGSSSGNLHRQEQPPLLATNSSLLLAEEVESLAGNSSESGELTPDADLPEVRVLSVQTFRAPPSADSVTIDWSTYLGSLLYDTSADVAVFGDAQYVAGSSMGFDLITRPIVARFDYDGGYVTLATIDFEGAYFSTASALALDAAGNVYLAGDTDFRFPGETSSGFALRLSADFSTVEWRLTYSGQAGAGNTANMHDIAVNAAGTQVWMTGGLNVVISDRTDRGMLVGRHNAVTGQQINGRWHRLTGSGIFTPAGASEGLGLAVNAQGIVYVAGTFLDLSSQTALTQAVCARLNADLTMNQYRYYTNDAIDVATGVVLDSASNAYLTGTFTRSDGSGITNLLFAKMNPGLTSSIYAFQYRDPNGAFLLGDSVTLNSANQPILLGTIIDKTDADILLYRMSTANPPQFLDAARFGGTSYEVGTGVATGPAGAVYATGLSFSLDYPTTPDVVQPAAGGFGDGVLTKLTVA